MKSKGKAVGSLVGGADLIIFAVLAVAAMALLRSHEIKSEDASATLVGALFGAAALLLGNWITRWNDRRKVLHELEDRRSKIKALVAAELVNVAAGLIGTKNTVDAFLKAAREGAALPPLDLLPGDAPRPMAFTDGLGAEILILEHRDIDVLTTLRSNLATTRLGMNELALGRRVFGLLTAGQLDGSIRHDLGLLSEAFECFAPERKLSLSGSALELASALLKRLASSGSEGD